MAAAWNHFTKSAAIIVAAGLCLVGFAIFRFAAPHQPSYQGLSTAQWVARLNGNLRDKVYAIAAIEALGTNALPAVARHLGRADASLLNHFKRALQRFGFHPRYATDREWRWTVIKLLNCSTETRRATILVLLRLAQDPNVGVRRVAVDCLCFCHLFGKEPEALHAIEAAEHDPDAVVRSISESHLHPKISKIIVAPSSGTEYPLPFETGDLLGTPVESKQCISNITTCLFR